MLSLNMFLDAQWTWKKMLKPYNCYCCRIQYKKISIEIATPRVSLKMLSKWFIFQSALKDYLNSASFNSWDFLALFSLWVLCKVSSNCLYCLTKWVSLGVPEEELYAFNLTQEMAIHNNNDEPRHTKTGHKIILWRPRLSFKWDLTVFTHVYAILLCPGLPMPILYIQWTFMIIP